MEQDQEYDFINIPQRKRTEVKEVSEKALSDTVSSSAFHAQKGEYIPYKEPSQYEDSKDDEKWNPLVEKLHIQEGKATLEKMESGVRQVAYNRGGSYFGKKVDDLYAATYHVPGTKEGAEGDFTEVCPPKQQWNMLGRQSKEEATGLNDMGELQAAIEEVMDEEQGNVKTRNSLLGVQEW